MFNFDEERFLEIQTGAVKQAQRIGTALDEWSAGGGGRNVFFAGTGGAGLLMLPAVGLLHARSSLPTYIERPAELILSGNAELGPGSLAVIPSLSGTTKESMEVLAYCRERGAKILTFTGYADVPLAEQADYSFVNFGEDDTSSESFYLQSLMVALTLMNRRGEWPDLDSCLEELKKVPELLVSVKRQFEDQAADWAKHIAGSDYHIISGAGSTWAEAFYYGMCILEEMQWIRTRPIHGADFFHGTLELVEPEVSVILLKGEDPTRRVMDRVEQFAVQYSDNVLVLDSAAAQLPGISEETRQLLSPVILATILERVSAHLEHLRQHPLTTRRYYKRVSY